MTSTKRLPKLFTASAAFSLLSLVSVTAGCLSDEEKEARRAWAYDLSGSYDESRAEGTAAGSVEIENETSKNDIKVTFTRGALYDGEQAYLDLVEDEEQRGALLETLVIGAGESELIDGFVGGENISDNFGESSTIGIVSQRYDATPKLEDATDAEVYYSLNAEIVNLSDELRGTLTIHYQDHRPSADEGEEGADETELHTESERFDILFKRAAGPIEGEVCDDCTTGPSTGEDGDPPVDDAADETGGDA